MLKKVKARKRGIFKTTHLGLYRESTGTYTRGKRATKHKGKYGDKKVQNLGKRTSEKSISLNLTVEIQKANLIQPFRPPPWVGIQ